MVFRSGPVAPGVAFITGGARGLGNAIGVSFSKEGARGVCLVDILDEVAFDEGKKNVEKYGAKVRMCSGGLLINLSANRPASFCFTVCGLDQWPTRSHRSCASVPT